jgi:hypothetical protein
MQVSLSLSLSLSIYIYIYRERERERNRELIVFRRNLINAQEFGSVDKSLSPELHIEFAYCLPSMGEITLLLRTCTTARKSAINDMKAANGLPEGIQP